MRARISTTRFVLLSVILSCSVLAILLYVRNTSAQELSSLSSTANNVVYQDDSTALLEDISILADETGFPLEDVEQAILFQEAFAAYTANLLSDYPNQISAIWVDPVPSTEGYIRFVDTAPAEVLTDLEAQTALDPDNVSIIEKGQLSIEEHRQRAGMVAKALVDLGYQHALVFPDTVNEMIQVDLKIPEEEAASEVETVVEATQDRIQLEQDKEGVQLQEEAAVIDASDLEITISRGTDPIIEFNKRGGSRMSGAELCTSGWSVSGPNGDGVITAGHCNGLDQIEIPGEGVYDTELRYLQAFGSDGDVEYHTTDSAEVAEFYSNGTSIRSVTGIRATNTMVNNSVCFYGRSSNNRTCNHTVTKTGASLLFFGSVLVDSLVQATNETSTGGDSGGGWSLSTTAWGVHSGTDASGNAYFTGVEEAQNALNLVIKTQ